MENRERESTDVPESRQRKNVRRDDERCLGSWHHPQLIEMSSVSPGRADRGRRAVLLVNHCCNVRGAESDRDCGAPKYGWRRRPTAWDQGQGCRDPIAEPREGGPTRR